MKSDLDHLIVTNAAAMNFGEFIGALRHKWVPEGLHLDKIGDQPVPSAKTWAHLKLCVCVKYVPMNELARRERGTLAKEINLCGPAAEQFLWKAMEASGLLRR